MRRWVARAGVVAFALVLAVSELGSGASRAPVGQAGRPRITTAEDTSACEGILSSSGVGAALGSPVIAGTVFDEGGVVPPLIHISCTYTLEDQRLVRLEVSDLVGPKGAPPFLIEKFSSGTPVAGLGRKAYAGWQDGSGVAWSQGLPGIDRTLILTGDAPLEDLIALARGQWRGAVAATNRPPVAKNDKYRIPAGGTLKIKAPGILKNDRDPDGDELTAELGPHTTLARSTRVGADGSVTIDFPDGWNGRACLQYTAQDSNGASSDPAFIRVTIGKPGTDVIADACRLLSQAGEGPQAVVGPRSLVPSVGGRGRTRSQARWYIDWRKYGRPFHMYYIYSARCWRDPNPLHWLDPRHGYLYVYWGYRSIDVICWRRRW